MKRTPLDERFRVAVRTTWYENVAAIQADLDRYLSFYKLERSHQGDRLQGRTGASAPRGAREGRAALAHPEPGGSEGEEP